MDSGIQIFISFSTHYYGLPKIYTLFKKSIYAPVETDNDTLNTFPSSLPLLENDLLKVSGYKSIGISIGSFGQVNIEQGLDITVGGEIRPGTELNAHLTDESSSLDGATREISEFDLIFITLKDQSFLITAGDQYVAWLPKGILSGNKKIKGLSATLYKKQWYTGGFGALSGGKYATEYIKVITGIQGPYALSANGENSVISPVRGTAQCRLNGNLLREGAEYDFTVDYDFGSITFTPKNLVTSGDIIKIEYEYKISDYQKVIGGVNAGFATSDSLLVVKGVLWSESDNRNQPIDQTISEKDLAILKKSGDNPPQSGAENAQAVHPNDAAPQDALYPLYKKRTDASGNSYFEHVRFNPWRPDSSKGFYQVWFSNVGTNNGEYDTASSLYYKDFIYFYVGPGQGSFSPGVPLTTPERVTTGEISILLNHSMIKADVSIAGQEHDRNLFSPIDDDDNLGSSGRITLLAGKKQYDKRSLWITGHLSGSSRHFNGELVSAWDRLNNWNDSSLPTRQHETILWEAGSGVTAFPGISTQFTYGQHRLDKKVVTDKLNNITSFYHNELIKLVYNGSFFRHNPFSTPHNSRIETIIGEISLKNQLLGISLQEKWRKDTSGFGTGLIGGGISYELLPWSLKQEVTYNRLKQGFSNVFTAADSGYQITWNQSIKPEFSHLWNLEGSTRYYRQSHLDKSRLSTFLINIASDVETKSGLFTSHQEYQSNSERSTSIITIPVYAGKGLGTHIYDSTRNSSGDSTLGNFIPHTPGDWIIEQREIADRESNTQMRKTRLAISWSLDPPENIPGIISDLRWEGSLFCEEFIDAGESSLSSWIPGVQSLKYYKKNSWSPLLQYSDCSYRQDLEWIHPQISALSADFSITPSLRQIQTYRETSLETALSIKYSSSKASFVNKVHYLSLFHNDSISTDYDIFNVGAEFIQRFDLKHSFNLYIQENIGIGYESDRGVLKRPFIFSEHYYGQINPGIQYRPFRFGLTDLSYTFSYVSIPGEYDYRIARGFSSGSSHIISLVSDFSIGKYFSIRGMYRGEIRKTTSTLLNRNQHIFSFEMKAFL